MLYVFFKSRIVLICKFLLLLYDNVCNVYYGMPEIISIECYEYK
jgi:hypothetical protein